MEDWERLIYHYRARVLTHPRDRIMAFAGIAQAAHNSNRMTYMAGSWAQIFPFSFTWSVDFARRASTTRKAEAVTEAVPSWSWFSVSIFSHDVFGFSVNDHIRRMLGCSDKTKIEPMYQASLLSSEDRSQQVYADLGSTRAFHDFTGIALNLVMKTFTGFLWYSKEPDFRNETITRQFDRLVGKQYGLFEYYLDRPDRVHTYSDKMTLELLVELKLSTWHESSRSRSFGEPLMVGLLMQPESTGEAYKRIGLWMLKLTRCPSEWKTNVFKSVSIFDQLQGVRSEHIRLV
jgi:hypothetical protein